MPSIEPTREQIQSFVDADVEGPIVMLNLLRYRAVADYSASPELAPDEGITGEQAYQRYSEAVLPHLEKAGAQVRSIATALPSVIGPADERWDVVLLVRYPSRDAFVAMALDPDYLAIAGHRTAALADSRLIPTTET